MRYKRERHAKPLGLIKQQHLEECLDHIGVISTPTFMNVYTTFELIHCLRARSLSKTKSGNQRVSLLSQCQNRLVESGSKLELCRVKFWGGLCFSKMELEGRFKNGTQKCEEDEIKGIQK